MFKLKVINLRMVKPVVNLIFWPRPSSWALWKMSNRKKDGGKAEGNKEVTKQKQVTLRSFTRARGSVDLAAATLLL